MLLNGDETLSEVLEVAEEHELSPGRLAHEMERAGFDEHEIEAIVDLEEWDDDDWDGDNW